MIVVPLPMEPICIVALMILIRTPNTMDIDSIRIFLPPNRQKAIEWSIGSRLAKPELHPPNNNMFIPTSTQGTASLCTICKSGGYLNLVDVVPMKSSRLPIYSALQNLPSGRCPRCTRLCDRRKEVFPQRCSNLRSTLYSSDSPVGQHPDKPAR